MTSTEPFWYKDPSVLFRPTTWYSFVPTADMSVDKSLNAVVRFVVYLSILLFLTSMDARYFLYVPAILMVTVALHLYFPDVKKMSEGFRGSPFVSGYVGKETSKPTPDNAFMNAPLTDIKDNPNRPPAPDVTDKGVRDQVNQAFAQTSNLYMDTSDAFDLMKSQRNFYTVPEDDHEGLLKFLGKNSKSDKMGNEAYAVAKGTMKLPTAGNAGSMPTGTLPTAPLA